jgi:hypothetical protein
MRVLRRCLREGHVRDSGAMGEAAVLLARMLVGYPSELESVCGGQVMTKIHSNRQDFTGPKGRGWRRCICTVEKTKREAKEYPSRREATRKKGNQCSAQVSPDRIAQMGGLPICKAHEGQWERRLSEAEEQKKALRAKYDPGPLPL